MSPSQTSNNKTVYLKNYLYIFVMAWLLLLAGKVAFLLFFRESYAQFSIVEQFYAIMWGVRFDLAVSAIVALLATFFDWHGKTLKVVTALLLAGTIVLQLSDMLYFENSGRHIGYEILDIINDAASLFLDAWGKHRALTLSTLIFFPLMLLLFVSMPGRWLKSVKLDRYFLPKKGVLVLLSVFFLRGMVAPIPLTPWQAIEIGSEELASLAMNGDYTALYSLFNSKNKLPQRFVGKIDAATTAQSFAEIYADKPLPSGSANRANVVFLFLESWNANNMQPYGLDVQTTPFFDSILQKALRPKAGIAGGIRTTEGMFSILASYQNPLGASVAKTQLQDKPYQTIIDLLREDGYATAFFQGTSKETSGTGAFALTLGFEQSFGKEDVIERQYEANDWGVYDQDLYQFTMSTLEGLEQPFAIGINGATTHDDKLPKGVQSQLFSDDTVQNKRLNALQFSDKALEAFIGQVEQQYPNTVFVLLADHTNWVLGSRFEHFMIPFAIYGTGVEAKYIDAFVSQRDVAPTVLDIVLGQYENFMPNATGKSLLRDQIFFADYYHNGVLGWVEGQTAIEYIPQANKLICYDVASFKPEKIDCQIEHEQLKSHAAAFTALSQKLLFAGKVSEFYLYRQP